MKTTICKTHLLLLLALAAGCGGTYSDVPPDYPQLGRNGVLEPPVDAAATWIEDGVRFEVESSGGCRAATDTGHENYVAIVWEVEDEMLAFHFDGTEPQTWESGATTPIGLLRRNASGGYFHTSSEEAWSTFTIDGRAEFVFWGTFSAHLCDTDTDECIDIEDGRMSATYSDANCG